MPTHNRAKWIPLAIACFLNQTFTDAELVILDNGTDNTADVIPAHPRIRYIRQPGPRLTTGEMRNLTCDLAQGDIFIHWDDDDWSAPERIATQLDQMKQSGKPFVGFHSISYWNTVTQLAYQYRGVRPYACGTSQCYRKDHWQQNRFPKQIIGEDSEFSSIARGQGLLDSFDGTQLIVARAHGANTGAPRLGNHQFPEVAAEQLPSAFLKAIGV
jgi:glycosyltransferase involved in cell wall biosynthesis